MSKKIVKVNSSLGGKKGEKAERNLSDRHRVLSAHESIEKSRDTKSLLSFMILIPIAIIILILLLVLFIIKQINDNKPQGFVGEAPSASENISLFSDEEEKKLLTLASGGSPLSDDYKPDLTKYNDIQYDSMLKEPLDEIIEAAKNDGVTLKVTSGYISVEEQNKLFQKEVERLMQNESYSRVRAESEAEKSVPRGGRSDRQTGLSVILSSDDDYAWLSMHAHEYGFILRYPENKEDETKVKYDRSLFRYVGKENAVKILMLGMSLDEYVSYVNSR